MPGKILYVASTFGHLATFHQPYLKWLGERVQVHAAAGGERRELEGVSRYLELPLRKSITSAGNFAAAVGLARILRQERYDLIYVHTSLAAFFTRLAVLLAGKRNAAVINMVHGYLFDHRTKAPKRLMLLLAEKLTAGVTDIVLTMNRQDTEIAEKHHLSRKMIRQVNGMGVDFSRFQPPSAERRAALRAQYGFEEKDFVLVYTAEFSPRKHQETLLRALPLLPGRVKLLLAGQGELLEECKDLASSLGVGDRVRFPGFVRQVEQCYQAGDVCVSSSRSEGLPFNLMEAMACGLPAVATQVKGHEDLIEDGENGFLFPYGEEKSFATQILRLSENPTLVAEMGQAARSSMPRYGLEQVFPEITAILEPFVQ